MDMQIDKARGDDLARRVIDTVRLVRDRFGDFRDFAIFQQQVRHFVQVLGRIDDAALFNQQLQFGSLLSESKIPMPYGRRRHSVLRCG